MIATMTVVPVGERPDPPPSPEAGLRKGQAHVDRQVVMLTRAWRDEGITAEVRLSREGNFWRLTLGGYEVSTWAGYSAAQVWNALLDMRRAIETTRVVREASLRRCERCLRPRLEPSPNGRLPLHTRPGSTVWCV